MRKLLSNSLIAGVVLIALIGLHQLFLMQDILAVEPICPGGTNPDPNVILCDDFEDGTWLDNWDSSIYCCDRNGDGIISPAEREAVTCGAKGFSDNCAAWTEKWVYDGFGYDGHFGIRGLSAPRDELYIRWYVYVSNPFVWSGTGDKNLILYSDNPDGSHINPYIVLSMWGTGKPYIISYNNSGTPCVNQTEPNIFGEYVDCVNRWQNKGNDITLQPGKWYLFEWYVKLNTPGVANGIARLRIDEAIPGQTTQTLRVEYTDMVYRPSNFQSTWNIQMVFLSPYRQPPAPASGQHQKWDNIVVSKRPIGPMGGGPKLDKVPPSPPLGLTVVY